MPDSPPFTPEDSDLLLALMDTISDNVYFKDRDSKFIRISKAMADFFGLSSPDIAIGKSDFDFFAAAHAQPAYDHEKRIIATGQPIINFVEKEVWPDGKVTWASTTKMPLRSQGGELIGTFGISRDVTDAKLAEAKIEQINKQLIDASRQAGMAEVATGVLHNVGNVLNSANISASVLAEKLQKSKVSTLDKVAALLLQNADNLIPFLTETDQGKQLPDFLYRIAKKLAAEQVEALLEVESLSGCINHIKEIVNMQQSFAMVAGMTEAVDLPELLDDAIRINQGAYARHQVSIAKEYEDAPSVTVDKHRVLQILVNLLNNAKYACDASNRSDKLVTLRIRSIDTKSIRIEVSDNGMGIAPENLKKIFTHGFTTRKDGHGFGLHSCALAAQEIHGSLHVYSEGEGKGANFILEFPVAPPVSKK